jgi:hypothetical protein
MPEGKFLPICFSPSVTARIASLANPAAADRDQQKAAGLEPGISPGDPQHPPFGG